MGYEYYISTIQCGAHSIQNHSAHYPVLAQMAWDYLPIQGLSMPSERALSNASLTDSKHRNWLAPDTFEALQILKSAYHNRHMSAPAEAEKYYDSIMSALEVEDPSVDGPASSFF